MVSDFPNVMNVSEAARYLRVSGRSIRTLLREGRLPGQKIGREWRLSRRALDDFLSQSIYTFATAPADDESYTEKQQARDAEALASYRRGEGIPDEELSL